MHGEIDDRAACMHVWRMWWIMARRGPKPTGDGSEGRGIRPDGEAISIERSIYVGV